MANSDKNIKITPSRNKTTFPTIVFTGSAAGTSVLTLSVLDDNTVSFGSTEGQVFSLDSNLSTGYIWGVSDISGIPLLRASAGGTVGIAEFTGVNVGIGTDRPFYKTHIRGDVGIASTNDGHLGFYFDSGRASGSAFLNVNNANTLRFYNSANSKYVGLKYTGSVGNIDYVLPDTAASVGSSYLTSSASGVMSFQPAVRRRHHRIQFGAALNPVAGADNAEFEIPFVGSGNTFVPATWRMLRLHCRVGTASATGSSFYVQKYAWNNGIGVSAFDVSPTTAAGSTFNIMSAPVIIQGATTFEVFSNSFAGSHITAVSGDKLRLNWLQASNTQYSFSINLYMEEDI